MRKIVVILCVMLTACTPDGPASVAATRRIVGTDLIGAIGATPLDQRKIDRTIVGLCAPQVYTVKECSAHGEAVKAQ